MSRRRNKKRFRPNKEMSRVVIPEEQPLLLQAEQKVESQLLPDVHEAYLKIVVAGMRAGMDKGPDSIIAGLRNSKDPIADCAKGAIGLVLLLKQQAKGVMPFKAMIPAATTLMLKALSFVDQTGIAKVGNEELVRATHIFAETFLGNLGITPEMLQHGIKKAHAMTEDPVLMEQLNRRNGITKHPDVQEPTQMPEGV